MKYSTLIAVFIVLLLGASGTEAAPDHTKGRAVKPFTPELKPGDYVWHPTKCSGRNRRIQGLIKVLSFIAILRLSVLTSDSCNS